MKNTNYISTQFDLFIISFHGITEQFIFGTNEDGTLGNLITLHGKNGIEFIKRFSKSESKFKTISKENISILFDWDTHSILELKKTGYIK